MLRLATIAMGIASRVAAVVPIAAIATVSASLSKALRYIHVRRKAFRMD
jgi:hypothetical protein